MYLPIIARLDGAFSLAGFSTRSLILYTPLPQGFPSITPYLCISVIGTSSSASIGQPSFSYSPSISLSNVSSGSITSSLNSTANGSSFTNGLAQRIACPRPSAARCLTYAKFKWLSFVISSRSFFLSIFLRFSSSSYAESKWSSIARLYLPVIIMNSSILHVIASSTAYCIIGLSTIGSISLGDAFVAGRNLVPSPPAGNKAFLIFLRIFFFIKIRLL